MKAIKDGNPITEESIVFSISPLGYAFESDSESNSDAFSSMWFVKNAVDRQNSGSRIDVSGGRRRCSRA